MNRYKPKTIHPLTQVIIDLYGTQVEFAKRQKICRPTAKRYMDNPDVMPFGLVARLCKKAKIDIKQITTKGKGGEDE